MSREEQQIGRGLSDQLGLTMACFFSGQRTVAGVGSVIHEVACTRVILTVCLGPRADSNSNEPRVPGESH